MRFTIDRFGHIALNVSGVEIARLVADTTSSSI